MKITRISHILLIFITIAFIGCGSSGGDDSPPTPTPPTGGTDDEPVVLDPSAATLIFPENNTECTTGIIDATNETLSTITFEWNVAQNADSYTVTVIDLKTEATRFTNSNTNSAEISLLRGAAYSWYVTSRATGTTATADSERFQFYSEGQGIENYAPFPAQALSPVRGASLAATSSVTLSWSGSDVDDDILNYLVSIDTSPDFNNGTLPSTSETSIENVPVESGNTYYWKVVTVDEQGNTSDSEIFEFRVN